MKNNLFQEIPKHLPEELITRLAGNRAVRIERIVSDGHISPAGFWFDLPENEWVLLISGSAVLVVETEFGIERVELCPGDHLLLPAHQRHSVESTSAVGQTIWLAVYFLGDNE